jgi:large subunit ribosomal protein L21
MTIMKNDKFAVVRVAGKQYVVSEGKQLLVDKLTDSENFEAEVLLVVDGEKVKVGKPTLKDVKVTFDVIDKEEKQEKIRVFKYKSKSRYRKHTGFRAKMTRLQLKSIS